MLFTVRAAAGPDLSVQSERSPLSVVDSVSKTRRVHDGQFQLDPLLLDVHGVLRDLHRLVDALFMVKNIKQIFKVFLISRSEL